MGHFGTLYWYGYGVHYLARYGCGGGRLSGNAISSGDSFRNIYSGHFQYKYVNIIIEP